MKNYYNILGIDQTATTQDIKHAHKSLQAQYSAPDAAKNGYAPEHYIELCVAYDTLINKEKRSEYDRILNSALAISRNSSKGNTSDPKKTAMPSPKTAVADTTPDDLNLILPKRNNKQLKYGIYIGSLVLLICAITFIQIRSKQATPMLAAENPKTDNHALQQSAPDLKNKRPDPEITAANTPALGRPAINRPTTLAPTDPVATKTAEQTVPPKKTAAALTVQKEINKKTPVAIALADKRPTDPGQELVSTAHPTIGTTKTEVLKRLGTPNMIVRYDNDYEIWQYTNRNIYFSNNKIVSQNKELPGNKNYE
jgi:curved DNA-binding protein CbpA